MICDVGLLDAAMLLALYACGVLDQVPFAASAPAGGVIELREPGRIAAPLPSLSGWRGSDP